MSADVGEMACIRPQNTPAHCLKTVILYRQMSARKRPSIHSQRLATIERY